jgi:hypothetical protein
MSKLIKLLLAEGTDLSDCAVDRIGELEAACWRMKEDRDRAISWRDHDTTRAEAAEAKLTKAMGSLRLISQMHGYTSRQLSDLARAALAELEGGEEAADTAWRGRE